MSPRSERSGGIPALRDIDGTPIAFHREVEQVADGHTVALRPDFVRVLTTDGA